MSKAMMVEFDKDNLVKALHKRGVTSKMASEKMGYSSNNIALCGRTGRISQKAVVMLDSIYNIDGSEYLIQLPVPAEPAKEDGEVAREIAALTDELRTLKAVLTKVIYSATKAAIVDAVDHGQGQALEKTLYEAVKWAMMDALNGGGDNDTI